MAQGICTECCWGNLSQNVDLEDREDESITRRWSLGGTLWRSEVNGTDRLQWWTLVFSVLKLRLLQQRIMLIEVY
jgi:hypothetical protein